MMMERETGPPPNGEGKEWAETYAPASPVARTRLLRKVELEITSECIVGRRSNSQGCIHCSLKAGTGLVKCLSIGEIRAILRDARDLGAKVVVLTGGEPAQHPEFEGALEYAKHVGLATRVYTTGIADAWARCRLDSVAKLIDQVYLSVEGIGGTHDNVLHWPGAFEHTKGFVQELQQLDVRWAAHFTPMRSNFRDLESVARLVHELGADSLKLIDFVPQGRGWTNRDDLELNESQYFELFGVVRQLRRELHPRDGSSFVRFHDETYTQGSLAGAPFGSVVGGGCTSGRESCAVLSDGTVIPCLGFRLELSGDQPRLVHVAGNVRTRSLRKIWVGSEVLRRFAISKAEDVNPACRGCSVLHECLGCCSCRRAELERRFDRGADRVGEGASA